MIRLSLEDRLADSNLEALLSCALEREKAYDWDGAAAAYEELVRTIPDSDALRRAEASERLAYSLHRRAFQMPAKDEFVKRIGEAVAAYSKAKDHYSKTPEPEGKPFTFRCDAMIELDEYWRAPGTPEKKRHVDASWDLAVRSMMEFKKRDRYRELADTCLQLWFSGHMSHAYSWDYDRRKAIVRDSMEMAELVTTRLAGEENNDALARTLMNLAFLSGLWSSSYASREKRVRYNKRSIELFNKALSVSEESAACQISDAWGSINIDIKSYVRAFEKALTILRKTGDARLTGHALDELSVSAYWRSGENDTFDEQNALLEKAMKCAREAREIYSVISYRTPNWSGALWIEAPEAAINVWHAYFDADVAARREYALRGLEHAAEMLDKAKESEYPEILDLAHGLCGRCTLAAAKGEPDDNNRREMLKRALGFYGESNRIMEAVTPSMLWNLGHGLCETASVRHELSLLAEDPERKRKELSEAIAMFTDGIGKMEDWMTQFEMDKTGDLVAGLTCSILGDRLLELHDLDGQEDSLSKSRDAYCRASRHFEHGGHFTRAAESLWSAAKVSDILGDHSGASELFAQSSQRYLRAIETVPRLRKMYEDHARYMSAWSEIELAKGHHRKQEALLSAQHFERAAELHRSTERWARMAPNYSAWACVEKAEELSRREENRESTEMFREAERLFEESRTALMRGPASSDDPAEDKMIADLVTAAPTRRSYCEARAMVEEARVLEKKGDIASSHDRYGRAVTILENLSNEVTANQDRREIMQVLNMTKAWQLMVKAEEESSPEMYGKAAELFEVVKEYSPVLNSKSLALGHSRFCKALEAGTRFADTGEFALHEVATQHLESASKHYLKAGFTNVAEYATACRLLFDAYVYMGKATKEESQEKRARLYAMAEKVLEASAVSYDKAGQPAKKDQVLKLLGKVRADKALALSLTEVFRAHDVVTKSAAFSGPTLAHEAATGFDRFEHANVQATLFARPMSLNVGEEFSLDIELVNAGRESAQLTKVEEAIPRGFGVKTEPMSCRIEGCHLNMRGRRLDPLRTEDIKLVLTPKERGKFTICPRVMYLDESGKYRSFEPDPVEITVRELGISGWLRGADSRR